MHVDEWCCRVAGQWLSEFIRQCGGQLYAWPGCGWQLFGQPKGKYPLSYATQILDSRVDGSLVLWFINETWKIMHLCDIWAIIVKQAGVRVFFQSLPDKKLCWVLTVHASLNDFDLFWVSAIRKVAVKHLHTSQGWYQSIFPGGTFRLCCTLPASWILHHEIFVCFPV